jgi:acetyl esterase/lipase
MMHGRQARVIVRRWEAFTGGEASREMKRGKLGWLPVHSRTQGRQQDCVRLRNREWCDNFSPMKCFTLLALLCGALSAQTVAAVPDGVEKRADLVYAIYGSRQMHLDLYLPKLGDGPFPAIVYIHGGGWSGGNKNAFSRQATYMATKGFVGACIEYRLSDEAKYPAAFDDAVAAVQWVRDHAQEYHIDPSRIGAAGGSSGGHLVALLGTMKGRVVQAVAIFNPVLDLAALAGGTPASNPILQFLGVTYDENPKLWREASPVTHVSSDSASFLFLHGDADATVPYQQSVAMRDKLKAVGVTAELFTAPGANHAFFNSPPWFEPTEKRMEEFFVKYLRHKP